MTWRIGNRKRKLKQRIIDRDGMNCHWCGAATEKMTKGQYGRNLPANACTLDHLVPRAHGGSDSESNLVIACHHCNHKRGAPSESPPITETELIQLMAVTE
jgi:5-methylcytosine-specific restriction endonuclease McrA